MFKSHLACALKEVETKGKELGNIARRVTIWIPISHDVTDMVT